MQDPWREAARHFLHLAGFSPTLASLLRYTDIKIDGRPGRCYNLNGLELFIIRKDDTENGIETFTAEYAPWAGSIAEWLYNRPRF